MVARRRSTHPDTLEANVPTRKHGTAAMRSTNARVLKNTAPAKPLASKKGEFICGKKFDFETAPSPVGPITRSRRSSIYLHPAPVGVNKSARKARKSVLVSLEEEEQTPLTLSSRKSRGIAHSVTKRRENQTPFTGTTVPPSATTESLKEKKSPEIVEQKLPTERRETKILEKSFVLKENNSIKPTVFTPQVANPEKLLRKNLKKNLEGKIDARVQSLPSNSPYMLMVGVTENGSPAEQLVKMSERPTRSCASKFLTTTPAPSKRRRLSIEFTKPAEPKKMLKFDEEDLENDENIGKVEESSSPSASSPAQSSGQWMTGDLGRICSIM